MVPVCVAPMKSNPMLPYTCKGWKKCDKSQILKNNADVYCCSIPKAESFEHTHFKVEDLSFRYADSEYLLPGQIQKDI